MAVTHTLTFTATGGSGSLSNLQVQSSGTVGTDVDVTVAASTSDQAYPLAIDISELESIYLYADGALTLETNSSSSPQETITFAANQPLVWYNGMPGIAVGDIFGGDVTSVFLTNGTGSTVRLRGLVNQSE